MSENSVCPVGMAGTLDNRFRRWFQNPEKILSPFVDKGMVALDLGCGPGFFSVVMAQMVGEEGKVIASDLQQGMLEKLKKKIHGTEVEKRITLHRCEENRIGLTQRVDFILAFYMVHEVPDQDLFFKEIESILNPGGSVLVVEPPIHVSRRAFRKSLKTARDNGFEVLDGPKILLSKTAVLKKSD